MVEFYFFIKIVQKLYIKRVSKKQNESFVSHLVGIIIGKSLKIKRERMKKAIYKPTKHNNTN